jgi:non-ribosomal peptide synthetase component E (peptide arylation enzyme)
MVPDRIYELETFPLSESGKINYLALAERAAGRSG